MKIKIQFRLVAILMAMLIALPLSMAHAADASQEKALREPTVTVHEKLNIHSDGSGVAVVETSLNNVSMLIEAGEIGAQLLGKTSPVSLIQQGLVDLSALLRTLKGINVQSCEYDKEKYTIKIEFSFDDIHALNAATHLLHKAVVLDGVVPEGFTYFRLDNTSFQRVDAKPYFLKMFSKEEKEKGFFFLGINVMPYLSRFEYRGSYTFDKKIVLIDNKKGEISTNKRTATIWTRFFDTELNKNGDSLSMKINF